MKSMKKKTEFIRGQVGYCLYSREQFKHNGVKWSPCKKSFYYSNCTIKKPFHKTPQSYFLRVDSALPYLWWGPGKFLNLVSSRRAPGFIFASFEAEKSKAGKTSCDLDLSVYVELQLQWWRPTVCFVAPSRSLPHAEHHGPSVEFPQGCIPFFFSPIFFFCNRFFFAMLIFSPVDDSWNPIWCLVPAADVYHNSS